MKNFTSPLHTIQKYNISNTKKENHIQLIKIMTIINFEGNEERIMLYKVFFKSTFNKNMVHLNFKKSLGYL